MKSKKPYCLMPWIHFHIGDGGMVKACCVANIPYGNFNTATFKELWQGDKIESVRKKFLSGQKDNRCASCINIEKTGGKSIRQETWEKYDQYNVDFNSSPLPVYFDIRFSNVCNFKCRTCWHGASSKWFNDAKTLGRNISHTAIIKNVNDFERFIDQLGPSIIKAKEIYFAGGEPLVTEEHYLLLKYLIDNNVKSIKLRYNTNFSVLQFKDNNIIDLWTQFDNIEILASIDATKELGELIRKEFDWKIFIENRKAIEHLKHIDFKIAPTISVLNIRHLPDLYKECLKLQIIEPDGFYINILERPYHYNIQCLPYHYKILAKQEATSFMNWSNEKGLPQAINDSIQECINYMMAEDKHKYWAKFLSESKALDSLRSERLDKEIKF